MTVVATQSAQEQHVRSELLQCRNPEIIKFWSCYICSPGIVVEDCLLLLLRNNTSFNVEIHNSQLFCLAVSVLQALWWRTVYCCYSACSRTTRPIRTSLRRAATFSVLRRSLNWMTQPLRTNRLGGRHKKSPTFTSCCSWFEPWSPLATPRTRLWPARRLWTSVVSGSDTPSVHGVFWRCTFNFLLRWWWWWWLFPHMWRFWENVGQIIPRLRFFSFFF